ncbi:MAG: S8 family serine peptidase [Phycisphaerae bacterium]
MKSIFAKFVAGVAFSAAAFGGEIKFHNGDALAGGKSSDRIVKTLEASRDKGDQHLIVQFQRPVHETCKRACAAVGIQLLEPLSGDSWVAALTPDADLKAVAESTGVTNVEAFVLPWKLDPMLLAGDVPLWAKVREENGQAVIGAYVLFHQDIDLDTTGVAVATQLGVDIRDEIRSLNGFVVEGTIPVLQALAQRDEVKYLEKALPQFSETNAENRTLTQAAIAQAAPYNLDGTGVSVMVYDGGSVRATHVDFGGRLTVRDNSPLSGHATHVAGTIGGNGVASSGVERGMAPNVTLESYGFQWSGTGVFFYTNPGDIEADYSDAIHNHGVTIANNSIGANVSINGFDCAIMGDYGVAASLIDAIVRGSLGQPFRAVFANGNERQSPNCGILYYTTAPPATGKNHITIGNVNANDDSINSSSSWGPTDDGRLKPDLVAPGCEIGGDGGVRSTSSSSNTAYTTMCGTSMAAPTFTGNAALLIQDYRAQFVGPDPRNSTLKILFAHSAVDLESPGPDYKTGYGSIRVANAIDLMREANFMEHQITQDDVLAFATDVEQGAATLKVTLAWDDAPAVPNVLVALVNDLDLRLIDPLGGVHYPWTLDPANPAAGAVRTQPDHLNNIEQVVVDNPMEGAWRIEIVGTAIPVGPQPFSIVADGAFDALPAVLISLPNGAPAKLNPGAATELIANVKTINDMLVANPELHFRYVDGDFEVLEMTPMGGELYSALLPPPTCEAVPEFFIRAEGDAAGAVQWPVDAPTGLLTTVVGTHESQFADDFEADLGWTVENSPSLTDGAWQRGVPAGAGDRGDPTSDYDGSGQCFLTANEAGNSDVDGGTTDLISPPIVLDGMDAVIEYAVWYVNNVGDNPNEDVMNVYVSDNAGVDWMLVHTYGPMSGPGWTEASFAVGDFVSPDTVQLRFEVSDLGGGSVVEAGVDGIRVSRFLCDAELPDCNGNAIVDSDDIAAGRVEDENENGIPDECDLPPLAGDTNCDGVVTVSDIGPFVLALTQPAEYMAQFPNCDILTADLDGDDSVSVSDIGPFVALLKGE